MAFPFYLDKPDPVYYGTLPWVTVDLETTNKSFGDAWVQENRVVCAAEKYADRETEYFTDLHDLANGMPAKCILVAHNAKFELAWMLRNGVDTTHWLVFDTMIAEYVLNGNRIKPLDLGSVAESYGLPGKDPVVAELIDSGVCPSTIDPELLRKRVVYDVETTYAVALLQYERMKKLGLLPVFFTRCIATPVLAAIEEHGMNLDPGRVEAEYRTQLALREKLGQELDALTGGINMRSRKQLAEYIYGKLEFEELKDKRGEPRRTPSGTRMTDAATLLALTAITKEQRRFRSLSQEYSKCDARLTKSLEFFRGVCAQYGGTFRASFNQCTTRTHRLSSSGKKLAFAGGKPRGVQFQNLPREYKRLFTTTRPGYKLVETDGAQLEFRVAGELGRDKQVLADALSGADIHRFTASVLLNKPEDQVTSEERTKAKERTFLPMYGGNSGTKREKEYNEAFRNKYSGVYETQRRWLDEVLMTGKLRSPEGLIYYWPGTKVHDSGYVDNTSSVFNYPIQAFATAAIIPVSLVYTYWMSRGMDVTIVNTVHDSVVAEVREDEVDAYWEVVKEAWTTKTYEYLDIVYGRKMIVPLGVEIKSALHWGDTKEAKLYNHGYEPKEDVNNMAKVSDMIPSKYLKKEDIEEDTKVIIKGVTLEDMPGDTGEQKWVMYFKGEKKGLILNNTNIRVLERAFGGESDEWEGKSVTLYVDENVSFGGRVTGGLRLRALVAKKPKVAAPVEPDDEDESDE